LPRFLFAREEFFVLETTVFRFELVADELDLAELALSLVFELFEARFEPAESPDFELEFLTAGADSKVSIVPSGLRFTVTPSEYLSTLLEDLDEPTRVRDRVPEGTESPLSKVSIEPSGFFRTTTPSP